MGTRMSVYVSDDLKKRMDKVKEPVNWSAVACTAFEQKLGEIAERKQRKNMADVIQRLRASKLESDTETERQAREAGRKWAMEYATARELENLEKAREQCGNDYERIFTNGMNRPAEVVASFATGQQDLDRADVEQFAERAAGEDADKLDDPDYALAFIDGALDVWYDVKTEL